MKTCLRTSKGGKNTLLTRNTNQSMRRKWHIASFCSPPPALNSSSKKSWSVNMSMLHDFKELTKLCLLFSSKEPCEQKPFSLIVGNQSDQVHNQSLPFINSICPLATMSKDSNHCSWIFIAQSTEMPFSLRKWASDK